jgi:oligopeptide/dipeptide ABC transporter ATP-binding protein
VEKNQLLIADNLSTFFLGGEYPVKAVQNVSFRIGQREVFGLVGESGCGKTMTALSIMRLIPIPGRIMTGRIIFEEKNLVELSQQDMQKVRGGRIGMIFQEPLTSLNPVLRIGDQIAETLLAHTQLSAQETREVSTDLLDKVGFDRPGKRYLQYPHQLSGGQRQRVLIAIAIACSPSLIIADEPTTALDVTIEHQILQLLGSLIDGSNMSLLFITHNLHIIRRMANRVGVMYTGRMVEQSPVDDFFKEPLHPYSKGLLDSVPEFTSGSKRLNAIPGSVPRLSELPGGCSFHPRCPYAMGSCKSEEPIMFEAKGNRWVRCFLYQN